MSIPMFPYISPGSFSGAAGSQPMRGISWPVKRNPKWNNLRHETPSGASIRIPLYPNNPLWEFEFTSEIILNNTSNPFYSSQLYTDLQIMTAFWYEMKGGCNEFVFAPPNNNIVNQVLSPPDPSSNSELVVTIGGVPNLPSAPNTFTTITESVQELNGGSVSIKANGVSFGNFSLKPPNTVSPYEGFVIHFNSTPTPPITATFTYYYRCNFTEDSLQFEDFMFNMTALKSIKIQQTRVVPY